MLRGDLTAADAEERMLILSGAPVVETAVSTWMPRAFAIAMAHSVAIYDSLYVALAEKHDIELVTADGKLMRRLSGNEALKRRMIWVGELSDRHKPQSHETPP